MDFFGNPTLQFLVNSFLAIIFGVVAIVTALVIFRKQSYKSLAYEIISDTPLLSLEKEIKGKIQVVFDQKVVIDAHIVILHIWNAGNLPITSEDFDSNSPLRFDFGNNAEALDSEVLDASSLSLKGRVSLQVQTGCVLLHPLLLNSRDTIKLKILISQPEKNVHVDARIAGVDQVLDWRRISIIGQKRRNMLLLISSTLIVILSSAFFLMEIPPIKVSLDRLLLMIFLSFIDGISVFILLRCVSSLGRQR